MFKDADPLGMPIEAVACMKTLAPRGLKSSAVPSCASSHGTPVACASMYGLPSLLPKAPWRGRVRKGPPGEDG